MSSELTYQTAHALLQSAIMPGSPSIDAVVTYYDSMAGGTPEMPLRDFLSIPLLEAAHRGGSGLYGLMSRLLHPRAVRQMDLDDALRLVEDKFEPRSIYHETTLGNHDVHESGGYEYHTIELARGIMYARDEKLEFAPGRSVRIGYRVPAGQVAAPGKS